MTAARLLDGIAIVFAALLAIMIPTGGWTFGPVPLRRPEDVVLALTVIVGLRAFIAPIGLPRVRPAVTVVVGVALYLIIMGFIVVTQHGALQTHALDLGQYLQIVWNIAGGDGPASTLLPRHVYDVPDPTVEPLHAWGDHFSPVLYLLAPLQWIAPGAISLLLVQTCILAAGAWAVFGYARRRLDAPEIAAGLALLYLINPSLHGINLRDIHPAAFAIPLVLAAALAFETKRYGWCGVALILTLACREDAAVGVFGFALWLAVARGRWIAGAGVAIASVLVLVLDLNYVMPHFAGASYPHLHYYPHLGSSLGEVLWNLVAHPGRWVGALVSFKKILYLLALLAPLAFLPLLAPRALAAALPGLAMNLLAVDPRLTNYRTQWQSFILPFLVLAAIEGYRRLQTSRERRPLGARFSPATALVVALLLSAALTARTMNYLAVTWWRPGPWHRAAYSLMARVPPAAPVSANQRLVPHLATRREIFVFPHGVGRSEYVLEQESVLGRGSLVGYGEVARESSWVLLRRS